MAWLASLPWPISVRSLCTSMVPSGGDLNPGLGNAAHLTIGYGHPCGFNGGYHTNADVFSLFKILLFFGPESIHIGHVQGFFQGAWVIAAVVDIAVNLMIGKFVGLDVSFSGEWLRGSCQVSGRSGSGHVQ